MASFFIAISSGLTSTQIGVVLGWLANIKTEKIAEAADVWDGLKRMFSGSASSARLGLKAQRVKMTLAKADFLRDLFPAHEQHRPATDLVVQHEMRTFMEEGVKPFIQEYKDNVRAPYKDELKQIDGNEIGRLIRSRRFHATVNNMFAAVGTGCAIYAIYGITQQPGWKSDAASITAIVATGLGAVGGAWTIGEGVVNLGKLIKTHINSRSAIADNTPRAQRIARLNQVENAATGSEFSTALAQDLDVQLTAPTIRLEQRTLALTQLSGKLSKVFGSFGVISDMAFLGVNIYNLIKDVNDKSGKVTAWQIGMDAVNIAISAAGAATGICEIIVLHLSH